MEAHCEETIKISPLARLYSSHFRIFYFHVGQSDEDPDFVCRGRRVNFGQIQGKPSEQKLPQPSSSDAPGCPDRGTLGGAEAAGQGRPDCSFWGRAPRAVRQSADRSGGGGCRDLIYILPRNHSSHHPENMIVDVCVLDLWHGWSPEGGLMSILARHHLVPPSLFLLLLVVACTMGCLQSIACKPRIRRENIVVYEVSASIDQCPTIIEENSPIVLRYKTPYFRASAGVVMPPVPRNETWVVGWIQACTQMEFYNTYGDIGMSSWELPELREGRVKAISDSDGVSYPWYGNTTETVTLTGPTSKPSRLTVSMNDNFYPSVTWAVPISNSNTPMLTHITRDQSFITWLVAMNSVTKERIVLQTVRWRMRVDIAVDPDMPLGSRASLVGRPYQEQPHILNYQEPIPPNALGRPNANDAQVLMWRPRRGAPLVVIPPK
ncbi:Protein fam78b [Xenotaenia resolanae]|uniref:Protein fam78b n=1 Tax=Xenotaenia resolanae TaxID=208358 RepID=A0ABV0VT47_9TELE